MSKTTQPTTTVQVEALATQLLGLLCLPQELHEHALKNLHYKGDYEPSDQPDSDGELQETILDICAEFPLLAALILLRDTLGATAEHFLSTDPEGTRAYLLIRPLEKLKEFCFGLSQLACFAAPDHVPESFRASGGRLKLCGQKLGRKRIRDGIRSYYTNAITDRVVRELLPDLLQALGKPGKRGKPVAGQTLQEAEGDELLEQLRKFTPYKPTVH